jgi:hypothetical protein
MTTLLNPIKNRMVADQAKSAIEGMTASEVVEKLLKLEAIRIDAQKWSLSNPLPWFRAQEVKVLEAEVAELALAYQRLENQIQSAKGLSALMNDHMRVIGTSTDAVRFQKVLRHWYQSELNDWESEGLTLIQMAERALERIKGPIPG